MRVFSSLHPRVCFSPTVYCYFRSILFSPSALHQPTMSSSDGELPPLLPGGSPVRHRSRASKRSRDSDTSSDSAFFSSDDLAEASIDRYKSQSRNKQYTKRSWYEPENHSRSYTYQEMRARQPKDSGIYVNSDSNNSSTDDGFTLDGLRAPIPSRLAKRRMGAFIKPAIPTRNAAVDAVDDEIQKCLEENCEKLDLMGLPLSRLPADIFDSLRCLMKEPRFDPAAFTEEATQPLTPELQVFLAGTSLEAVPRSLIQLETLKVLSLRNNCLTEIPSAVGHLSGLVELNLAFNQLKWLPWGLLSLLQEGKLAKFHSRPNPLLRPLMPTDSALPYEAATTSHEGQAPRLRKSGCSTVSFFQQCGMLHPASLPAPSQSPTDKVAIALDPMARLRAQDNNRVPSLLELTMRQCSRFSNLAQIPDLIEAPDTVLHGLKQAEKCVYEGGAPCSVCGHEYIIARAEWIEFWQQQAAGIRDSQDAFLPFLRRTCSWGCAASAHM